MYTNINTNHLNNTNCIQLIQNTEFYQLVKEEYRYRSNSSLTRHTTRLYFQRHGLGYTQSYETKKLFVF